MKPYICAGAIVQFTDLREGTVICVDTSKSVAIVRTANSFLTEDTTKLKVVSYKEVE